ncbi:MAG: S41 family peptidase [Bacteroidaceae bacterium]|nr:S41 family peptidase [Bacteroidaceae bacterium]
MPRLCSIIRGLIVALTLPLLAGCVSEESFEDTPEGNFEALWTIIDEHYCFLDYKRQTLGVDWDEVHSRYRSRISEKMDRYQLFEVLAAMLSELRDGHVNLYSSADIGRNWSWHEDFPSNYRADLRDAYLGTDYKIASGLRYRFLDDNIAYVVCSSFSNGIGEGNLDEVMHYLRSANGLILDLRDNSGGNLTNAETLAARFTDERRLVGYMCHKTGKGHNAFSKPKEQYLEPSKGVRWMKRAIVLTNRSCYSATNVFVRDVKGLPRITILGDQTGGGSGLPFSSELPGGWAVRFSACPMFDAEKRQIEFGIEPDIYVSLDEADAAHGYDTLIERARQLLAE